VRQSYRLNVGTIVEEPMLKVKLVRGRGRSGGSTGAIARGGRMLGQIEEYFIEGLVPGDTFVFGGEIVRYEALMEDEVYVTRTNDANAKVPSYMGGYFPRCRTISRARASAARRQRAWPGQARSMCATGCRCRSRSRGCRGRANRWSKRSRAPASIPLQLSVR